MTDSSRGDSVSVSITLPMPVVIDMHARQKAHKITRSELVRDALAAYLATPETAQGA